MTIHPQLVEEPESEVIKSDDHQSHCDLLS